MRRKAASLALVLMLALASVAQAAPVRGSGVLSWWDFVVGFFGLKAEPSLPIPPSDGDGLTLPRPGDPKDSQPIPPKPAPTDGNKGRLHLPGGWTAETEDDYLIPPRPDSGG